MFLQAPDDYYEVFFISSFLRVLRYFSFAVSLFLPGIYVAVLNYHVELVPTSLLLRIQATREGFLFPVMVEVILMEVAFEILREAGLRLPGYRFGYQYRRRPHSGGCGHSCRSFLSCGSYYCGLYGYLFLYRPQFRDCYFCPPVAFCHHYPGGYRGLMGLQFALLALLIHMVSFVLSDIPLWLPSALYLAGYEGCYSAPSFWQLDFRPKLLGFREPRRQRPGQKARPRNILRGDKTGREEE